MDRLEPTRVNFYQPVRGKQYIDVTPEVSVAFDKSDGTIAIARGPEDVIVVHMSNCYIDMRHVATVAPRPVMPAPIEPGSMSERQAVTHEVRSETEIVKLQATDGGSWKDAGGDRKGKKRKR